MSQEYNFKTKTVKSLFVLLSTIFVFTLGHGQSHTGEKGISNAEKFSSKAGTLIAREFIDVGTLKTAKIKVVNYTNLVSGDSVSALRFEYKVSGSYSSDTKIAVLDSDEIDGLISSIKMISEDVLVTSPVNYTEVTYKSRSGFQAGCFGTNGDWSIYLKLEEHDGKSYVFLKKDDILELLVLMEKARSLMK